MEFGVLGPLTAADDGRPVAIGNAHKPRLLLAVLLARAGQPASLEWLTGTLWPLRPPPSARRNLQQYLHRLRRALGAAHLVNGPGGVAAVVGDNLDSVRFAGLAARAAEHLSAGRDGQAVGRPAPLWIYGADPHTPNSPTALRWPVISRIWSSCG